MSESRISATDRLRQEGRQDEACFFRDDVKKLRRGWRGPHRCQRPRVGGDVGQVPASAARSQMPG